MKTLKSLEHPDGSRRVDIVQRDDGTFGFEEWKYLTEESAWTPVTHGRSISWLDSYDAAIIEAKDRIEWLRGMSIPDIVQR